MKHYIKGTLILLGIAASLSARENTSVFRRSGPTQAPQVFAGCEPSRSRADLDVNNVRCPIFINGDMWWDLAGTALYEVPVGSGKHSLFSGAIWIGGKDGSGQLKVAAQTYRQSGSDFWPGPVDTTTTTISADVCLTYDKHFKISFAEVKNFHEQYQVAGDLAYPIPDIIKNWPGNGNTNPPFFQTQFLAPFYDRSGDGIYDYNDGDYPKFDVDNIFDPCDRNRLFGDQTIWWVFNDVGNSHGETGSLLPVGVEIQAQAFGFNTNDEVNNMTFYRYKIINRASTILTETYFGSWVDPDLGNYLDDFVGCDVERGLGYCYNGDEDDDGALGYGQNPPAVGLDFFEGPIADAFDGKDNDRDGVIDEAGEQIIMSKFVYYNNDNTNIGNPNTAQQYYNYLDGRWKNNARLVYGGTGFGGNPSDTCDFMFPGDSDPNHIGTFGVDFGFNWSETLPCVGCAPNEPSDRRFLQSAGKFTLLAGAVNFITTGAVWARTSSGGANASVKLLKIADVKAQNLFDACFRVLDGPDAPVLSLRELNKEIIISLQNPVGSNNYREGYREKDSNIPIDSLAFFEFEGYKVYQVKDPSVTINDLHNADVARLVFQSDIANGLGQIVNKVLDGDLNAYVPTEEVAGTDKGLRHSFRITSDAFALGDPGLVNHKTYYFLAVAYGYDPQADVLDPFDPPGPGLYGQPYIQSRKNPDGTAVSVYTAIPHIPDPEADGLILSTSYNDGPEITRITGIGNGYIIGSDRPTLELKQEQVNSILFNASNPTNRILNPTYVRGRGPVDIRVYDPLKIPPAEFELWLTDTVTSTGYWVLKNVLTGKLDTAEKTLTRPYDQLFPNYGFTISMSQVNEPGQYPAGGNGAIGGSIIFSNPSAQWLSFLPDVDNFPQFNWILAGNNTDATLYDPTDYYYQAAGPPPVDGSQFYEKILGGTWAPFRLSSNNPNGWDYVAPAPFLLGVQQPVERDSLRYLGSVDVVITPDKSKWSRCVVFEMGNDNTANEGGQGKNLLRKHASMNIDGTYSTDPNDMGRSWFPGYALNVETGERLNIAFSEDSYLAGENGADMKWNPSSNIIDNNLNLFVGGKHYIYVFNHKNPESYAPNDTANYCPAYDSCNWIYNKISGVNYPIPSASRVKVRTVWENCEWVSVPFLTPGQTFLDNEVRIRLRVTKPYRQYDTGLQNSINNNFPYYKFNTYDLAAKVNQIEVAKSALDLINVVPNPYYAYSNYETNQLDNRVKIVNLPNKCVVSIYTTNGTLIRRYKRDAGAGNAYNNTSGTAYPDVNLETSIDWDLKNSLGIPVASGMYLIHVSADGIGERTLKWFGVARPIDLDTF